MQVHLRVDTTLTNNKLDVVAYVARHLTLGDRSTSLAQEFQQVPCEVRTVEVERLGSEVDVHHSLSTLLCLQLVRLHATMVLQTRILKPNGSSLVCCLACTSSDTDLMDSLVCS